jgi:hypothetical protein
MTELKETTSLDEAELSGWAIQDVQTCCVKTWVILGFDIRSFLWIKH